VPGFSAIDTARSQIATDAVARGFEELMWIDSDMEFDPAAVERLRSHNLPIVGGLYSKKGTRALASALFPETQKINFGEGAACLKSATPPPAFSIPSGRSISTSSGTATCLPVCNLQFNKPLVPFFMTMVVEVEEEEDRRSDVGGQKPEGAWAGAHATGSVADTHSPTHHSPQPDVGGQSPFAADHLAMVPDSQKGTVPGATRHWYLSEDFSFSHRARQAGYKIFADTTIRLGHIGRYSYAWEVAGMTMPRFGAFEFHVSDAKPPANGK
jgi:hypothetical protein